MFQSTAVVIVVSSVLFAAGCAQISSTKSASASSAPITGSDWPAVTQLNKPWSRWWWMGSAVDKPNLTREIEMMEASGIGGVEITPLYGVNGYESRDIEFLSPKWIEMLEHAGREGKRLNFGVDMATGTGWPFGGGPVVTFENSDAVVNRVDGKLVARPSMMKVKRAAPGDEGWVLNPYSVDAIKTYLAWFDKPLSGMEKGLIRGQFHDSFEYAGNWTPELPAKFKQMHGYDINDHVNELFGEGDPDTVGRVKSDYRETLSQMHYDYVAYWVKWSNDHGFEARNQAHGAPGNLLDLYAISDVPETETFGSTPFKIPGFRRLASDIASNNDGPNEFVTRFATSAQHVMGRPLSSSETLTWLRDHFKVAPSMAKPEIDQMLITGINHILYHGTCYSPEDAPWPGWQFYASSEINPRDTLWKTMPEINAYITRCQSILQSGSPDNDVLIYYPMYDQWDSPEGMEVRHVVHNGPPWLVGTEIENTMKELTDAGYAYDMVSDMQLEQTSAADGGLRVPGGDYRVLLVPKTRKMPVQTLARILKLAEDGATVLMVGGLPADVPGLANLETRRTQFKELGAKLNFVAADVSGIRSAILGTGRVLAGDSMPPLLNAARLRREEFAGERIELIRRKHEKGHHYFIAALGDRGLDGWAKLAVKATSAVLMDPLTGRVGVGAIRSAGEGSEVYLQLKPGQSIIVRTFTSEKAAGDAWQYMRETGAGTELTGVWRVDFIDGAPGKPQSYNTPVLGSWAAQGDDEARRYAGTARYRLEFDRPANVSGSAMLDLGDIREAAVVRLNGNVVGPVWALPFQIPVSGLKDRGNVLEIDVTNLAANRIRDLDIRGVNWRIFKEINYVNIDYKPFDAKGWAIVPSGLMGPVKLIATEAITPGK